MKLVFIIFQNASKILRFQIQYNIDFRVRIGLVRKHKICQMTGKMFPLFLRLPDRKVLNSNISTNQTKIRNVCLSVILEFSLLSSLQRVYSLNQFMQRLVIFPIFIKSFSNIAGFFDFQNSWFGQKHSPMSEKNIYIS